MPRRARLVQKATVGAQTVTSQGTRGALFSNRSFPGSLFVRLEGSRVEITFRCHPDQALGAEKIHDQEEKGHADPGVPGWPCYSHSHSVCKYI